MHRRCITLISSLLTPSGWVRKPLNYLKVRTGMYRYILLRTNMEFLYCPVPSRTGTYWYVPVRTILPNPVQGYRIPDVLHASGIVKSYMAFLKDDSFKHTSCKRAWASRSEVLWEVFCLLDMVGFDSEDLKRVGAHSPLGQKHTAWIRTGNLPVI